MGEIIPVPHLFLANVWPWLTSRDVPVIPPLALQELIEALRKLGYRVDTPNNKLPALFHGKGPMRGSVTVSVEVGEPVDLGGSWIGQAGFAGSRLDREQPGEQPIRQCFASFKPRRGVGCFHSRWCQSWRIAICGQMGRGVRTGHAANRFAFLIWPLDI